MFYWRTRQKMLMKTIRLTSRTHKKRSLFLPPSLSLSLSLRTWEQPAGNRHHRCQVQKHQTTLIYPDRLLSAERLHVIKPRL